MEQSSPWPLAIALFFIGFVVTFFAAAYFLGPKGRAREEKEGEAALEEPPAPKPDLAEKVSRLTKAHESGRLSREAYEANLAALGVEPPKEAEEVSEADEHARKVERLRATYERGRISRQVYEENLRALGEPGPPPDEGPASAAIEELEEALGEESPTATDGSEETQVRELESLAEQDHVRAMSAEPTAEDFTPDEIPQEVLARIAAVKKAYVEGRFTLEKYEEFLAKAYEGVDERFALARMDLEAGVKTEEEYREAVRALLAERE